MTSQNSEEQKWLDIILEILQEMEANGQKIPKPITDWWNEYTKQTSKL